jgi:hypothetical protein
LDHGANPQPPPPQPPSQPLNTTNQGYHQINANFVNYNHPSPAYTVSTNQQVDASYYSLNQHPNNMPMYINLNSDGLQVSSINNNNNTNSNNSNIPYMTVPLPQQQATFNLVQSQLLPQQQQSPHIYVPVNSYMYQQQNHHQYVTNLSNKTQDTSKNPTPQLTFNKGNNRNYVPLYCGTCRTYGCQCFYSSTDVANTSNSQEVLPSTNNQQHHHQHHHQSANVNLYSNGHQNAAAIKANIEQQQQQYAAAAATAYYNYIQTSSQQQKQAFLEQQKNQIEQNRIQVLNQSLKDLNLNKLSSSPTSSSSSSSSSSSASSSSSSVAASSSSSTTNPINNASGASSSNANQTEISNTNEINAKQLSNASLSVKNETTTTATTTSKNSIIYSQIPILVHQQQSHQYQLSSQLPLQYLPTNSTLGNLSDLKCSTVFFLL